MCRFIAYIGKNPKSLEDLIFNESNSLVKQSKEAKEGITSINADGFGIAWYDLNINDEPSRYRSILPAWNDPNLKPIISKIRSTCFLGHVRAATVGEISYSNCHPFKFNNRVFMHNGTIRGFEKIKHDLTKELSTPTFLSINGQSDSEYFFALLNNFWDESKTLFQNSENAFKEAIKSIKKLRDTHGLSDLFRLNCIISDGRELVALRYNYPESTVVIPIYYKELNDSFIIASEPTSSNRSEWQIIPENHLFQINSLLEKSLQKIE